MFHTFWVYRSKSDNELVFILARRSGGDNKLDVKHLYIGVLIAIVSFIIGITVGIIFSKKCHTKESKSEESLIRGEKV